MSKIWIARRTTVPRQGLFLQTEGTKANPSLMFFLPGMDSHQLDQLVRSELGKQGISSESQVNAVIEKAESQYEHRRKVEEARVEIRRLMSLKKEGATLMQVGHRKWKTAFMPSVKRYLTQKEAKG